ncbi:SRPBCC family protein [Streptomyces sp. B6B3]|uniref:SRPBCC family protein n=1 Tax=Streptomyces sp. B6B3 TaxID=3153570 RepID=UPI00325F50AA
MAEKQTPGGSDLLSQSVDRLRKELMDFAAAQIQKAVSNAGGRITEQVGEAAGGATSLPKMGAKMVGKNVKDKVGDAAKKVTGGGDGDGKKKGKSTGGKFTTIIETLDIGMPLRLCYDHWCEFEGFSDYMKGVQGVSRSDDVTTDWKLKIGPSARGWKATVQEQVPDDRIEWSSEGAQASTRGVVSFHELTPKLTRIVVVVEYYPAGFFEKTANLWRAQGRRLRLDLKHFQRFVTLIADEPPEGWRGEIRDGEVVRSHEDALAEEERGGDEDREGADEDEDEYDRDEDRDEDEDEEGEGEEEEEEEDEDYEERGRR